MKSILIVMVSWLCLVPVQAQQGAAQQAPQRMVVEAPEARVPDGGVVVPIVELAPNPVVEVRVNGRGPFRFMLDTGGYGHARADAALVEQLGLQTVGEVMASDGSGRGGRAMAVVRLDRLEIGGAEFRNLDAPSRDYNAARAGRPGGRIDGVLGIHLFMDYLLTIDFPNNQIRIEPGRLPEPDGRTVLAYDRERGVPVLPIRVGDVSTEADIDTGSMASVMLPMSMAERLPLASEPVEAGRARTVANDFVIYAAPLDAPLRIGSHEVPGLTIQLSEVFPRPNVGMQVLREFALTIDQKAGRIRFAR